MMKPAEKRLSLLNTTSGPAILMVKSTKDRLSSELTETLDRPMAR